MYFLLRLCIITARSASQTQSLSARHVWFLGNWNRQQVRVMDEGQRNLARHVLLIIFGFLELVFHLLLPLRKHRINQTNMPGWGNQLYISIRLCLSKNLKFEIWIKKQTMTKNELPENELLKWRWWVKEKTYRPVWMRIYRLSFFLILVIFFQFFYYTFIFNFCISLFFSLSYIYNSISVFFLIIFFQLFKKVIKFISNLYKHTQLTGIPCPFEWIGLTVKPKKWKEKGGKKNKYYSWMNVWILLILKVQGHADKSFQT